MDKAVFCTKDVKINAKHDAFQLIALGTDITAGYKPFFHLEIENVGNYDSSNTVARVITADENLLSVMHTSDDGIAAVRIDFTKDPEGLRISCTVSIRWPDTPQRTRLKLDWLNAFAMDGADIRYPSMTQARRDGADAMQHHETFPMPLTMLKEDGSGIAVYFDIPAAGLGWDRLRNQQINRVDSREALDKLWLNIRVDAIPALVADVLIQPFNGGWKACFENIRRHAHINLDEEQYCRQDLEWIRSRVLNHFAFVYSDECYDFVKQRFDMQRLLDQGEAFGGYDTVLIWHQYPRLGLDERSQWDFFEQFPGGLEALREAVEYAHSRGTRVLLPFKPWDHSPEDDDTDTVRKLCHVMAATDADGLFFDTMNSVPASFRKAVDSIRPGIVFMTEITPQDRRSIEMLTSSWDQYWTDWEIPEAPLFRYLFPEHATSMIARWHVGVQKDNEIKRAIFNGTGLVIWQDIFGAWLPFDAKQKRQISEWKKVYLAYRDCFEGNAVPLVPTAQKGIYMNLFEGNGHAVAALYNDTDHPVKGLIARNTGYTRCGCIMNDSNAEMENGDLYAELESGVVYLLELN